METSITEHGNGHDVPAVVETAATAAAARAKAVIEARYVVAIKRPRVMDEVRVRLLKECERPAFAEVAKYEKPVGGSKIVGLSVRFAESAIRLMGNLAVEVFTTFDDATRRIVRVEVVDLETNTAYGQDIPIEKTVERSQPTKDREILGQRTNTQGKTVYLVAATEDEFMNKQNSAISKVLRNHGLRLIPGDILEECSQKIDKTYSNKAAQDPEAEKKKIIDSFATIGVLPSHLATYLEHGLEAIVPAELAMLRRLYQSIRDGETTWKAVMEEKFGEQPGDGENAERQRPRRKSETKPPAAETTRPAAETKPAPAEMTATPPVAPSGTVTELEGGSTIVRPLKTEAAPVPNGDGKLDMKLVSEIYAAMNTYNEKHGVKKAQELMERDYEASHVSKLRPHEAQEFLERLRAEA